MENPRWAWRGGVGRSGRKGGCGWLTKKEQFHILGGADSIFLEILLNCFAPFQGGSLFRAQGTSHGGPTGKKKLSWADGHFTCPPFPRHFGGGGEKKKQKNENQVKEKKLCAEI